MNKLWVMYKVVTTCTIADHDDIYIKNNTVSVLTNAVKVLTKSRSVKYETMDRNFVNVNVSYSTN